MAADSLRGGLVRADRELEGAGDGCACHGPQRQAGARVACRLAGRRLPAARQRTGEVQALLAAMVERRSVDRPWLVAEGLDASYEACLQALRARIAFKSVWLGRAPFEIARARGAGVVQELAASYAEHRAAGRPASPILERFVGAESPLRPAWLAHLRGEG